MEMEVQTLSSSGSPSRPGRFNAAKYSRFSLATCNRWYPYFDVPGSEYPDSYASGKVAAGRVFHGRHAKGNDPDEKGYPSPPGWVLGVLGVSPITSPRINKCMQRNPQRCFGWNREEWRRLLKVARAQKGLQRHTWMHGLNRGVGGPQSRSEHFGEETFIFLSDMEPRRVENYVG